MATCGSTSSSSSDSNFSNSSGEDQPQPLLLSWAYLTPPELEIATDHLFSTRATVAPPRVRRRIKEEHFTKKEEKNAKERDRVKRLNTLYINLRSVLGGESRESKLSKVPVLHAAICYIRSLDKELQELEQKHQQLKMSPDQQNCDGPRAVLPSLQQPTITPEQSKAQQISVSQLSCTCELTVRHSVISLDCTEVYDESLNSDTESPQPAPLVDVSTVQSILPSPNFISSPQECLQELARINMMSAGSMYLHSPPHLMPASTCLFNPPGVEMMVEEFAELPSSHHPWAISPSHPPPLSHFAYQPM